MKAIGLITIGQTPRNNLVREVTGLMPDNINIIQAGALDGLDLNNIRAHQPTDRAKTLVTKLRDGSEALVDKDFIHFRLQQAIQGLEIRVDFIGILCSSTFPTLFSSVPLLLPYRLLQGALLSVSIPTSWGVLVPSPDQKAPVGKELREWGLDVIMEAVSPYSASDDIEAVAAQLAMIGVSSIFLNCFGYSLQMKDAVQKITQKPVISIRSLFAHALAEIVS
jgi:protein AroM